VKSPVPGSAEKVDAGVLALVTRGHWGNYQNPGSPHRLLIFEPGYAGLAKLKARMRRSENQLTGEGDPVVGGINPGLMSSHSSFTPSGERFFSHLPFSPYLLQ
jgi:hypothetical protein